MNRKVCGGFFRWKASPFLPSDGVILKPVRVVWSDFIFSVSAVGWVWNFLVGGLYCLRVVCVKYCVIFRVVGVEGSFGCFNLGPFLLFLFLGLQFGWFIMLCFPCLRSGFERLSIGFR